FSAPIWFVPALSFSGFSAPMLAGWRIGSQQSGRGIVSLAARGADHFQTGLFGFHAQVADYHLVNAGLYAGQGLGGTGRSFNFKSLEFENGFEGQQDGEIVIDEKNAAFHVHLLSGAEMQCIAEWAGSAPAAIARASQIAVLRAVADLSG